MCEAIQLSDIVALGLLPDCAVKSSKGESYWIPRDHLALMSLPCPITAANSPDFEIVSINGICRVIAIIMCGKRARRVILRSKPAENYIEALRETSEMYLRLPTDVLPKHNDAHASLRGLLDEDRKKLKFPHPKFDNIASEGQVPGITCSVEIKGELFCSEAFPTRGEAIENLAAIINSLPLQEKKEKNIPVRAKSPSTKKSKLNEYTTTVSKKDFVLLQSLVARWRREQNWLISLKEKSLKEDERIFFLSRYLAVVDPLRWFEVSQTNRNEILNKIEAELCEQALRMTKDGLAQLYAQYLRETVRYCILAPGEPVDVGNRWRDKVQRCGDDPSQVISRLVELGLLRVSNDSGAYLLSNLGITFMENNIKYEIKEGSIGSVLSRKTLLALLS